MASQLTSEAFEMKVDGATLATARLRTVFVFLLTLLAVVVLAATVWLQVAARFDSARVRTEGETIRNAMGGMLSMGLPLEDFIGFQAVSSRIFTANPAIRAIGVRDRGGRLLLSSPVNSPDLLDRRPPRLSADPESDTMEVDESAPHASLAMPIQNRFGPVGSLELVYSKTPADDLVRNAALAGLAAIAILAVGLAVHGLAIANPEFFASRRDLLGTYAMTGVLGLVIAGSALTGLVAEKAEETAGAYAYSLGARIGEAVALGISPDDLSGLDEVVREYRESNSIVGYVALLEGNRIATATGLDAAGIHWDHPHGYFDAVYEVRPRRLYTPQYRVAVGIRWGVAFRALVDAAIVPAAIAVIVLLLGAVAVTRLRVQEEA